MSNALNITVNAPVHHGSVSTAVLLKILLGKAMPDVTIKLSDDTIDANSQEQLDQVEKLCREQLEGARTAEDLNTFFSGRGIEINISATNFRIARPEEVEAPALQTVQEF